MRPSNCSHGVYAQTQILAFARPALYWLSISAAPPPLVTALLTQWVVSSILSLSESSPSSGFSRMLLSAGTSVSFQSSPWFQLCTLALSPHQHSSHVAPITSCLDSVRASPFPSGNPFFKKTWLPCQFRAINQKFPAIYGMEVRFPRRGPKAFSMPISTLLLPQI